jgi:S-adenosylmethionine synthetase
LLPHLASMQITVSQMPSGSARPDPVEIVERKGLGHPDTLCDALAEEFSLALCRFYRERFGLVLHHNVDKVLLRGGIAHPAYGGGVVVAPIEIYLAGRATAELRGEKLPIEELAIEACRSWLRGSLHALDPDRHVQLRCLVRPGSAELVELYERQRKTGVPLANDTSCGVGSAPLTDLEATVLGVEQRLNRPKAKRSHPEVGEDIKVMGVRRNDHVDLTVACAFVDRFVSDLDDYLAKKERLRDEVRALSGADAVEVNTGDEPAAGSVYLTVTGTSAEAGDDGQAGRGNRANGLITPYRPMTLESTAGKNPITHVGKLYNAAARLIAEAIVEEIADVAAAQVFLVSQIGRPVTEPQVVDVKLDALGDESARRAEEIARDRLAGLGGLWEQIVARAISLY